MNSVYTPAMFPVNSRIRLPCSTLYEKLGDGEWHHYQGGALAYDRPLPSNHDFPHGSEMFYNDQHCFVKGNGRWRPVNPVLDPGAPFADHAAAYTAHGHGQLLPQPTSDWWSTGLQLDIAGGTALTQIPVEPVSKTESHWNSPDEESNGIQILEQVAYRHGPQLALDLVVEFLTDMPAAARGEVPDAERPAYAHDLVRKEKVAIRFGFPHANSCSYRTKQRTIMRSKEPVGITRGRLAALVAHEVRELVDALKRNGTPLKSADGRALKFEELVLVDIKRVSTASIQPTIGIRHRAA